MKKNIKQVYDLVDGELEYEIIEEIDYKKSDDYKVIVRARDCNGNVSEKSFTVHVKEKPQPVPQFQYSEPNSNVLPTYINGILLVNKQYAIPESFGGTNSEASNALYQLQSGAKAAGYSMPLLSGYRSYSTQKSIYNNYVSKYGVALTDTFSARPGHSEHQAGLAFDVSSISDSYGETAAGQWLKENCSTYGFIIRYPQNKVGITGYKYEPWHIRYVGVSHAQSIMSQGICLEEYLGV